MDEQQLIDKWIKEMKDLNISYDNMIRIFKLAEIKWKQIKADEFEQL